MRKQLTQVDTLFDDHTFDVSEPSIEIVDTPAVFEGIAVELGARALALHNIMATYNQLNKTRGARITGEVAGNEFDQRYQHPDEVRENMGRKAAKMLHFNKADFETLNATHELIAAGFPVNRAADQERQINKDLLDKYGPGKVYADTRSKVVIKAQRAIHRKQ